MDPKDLNKTKQQIELARAGNGQEVLVEGLHAVKHALRFKAEPNFIICRDQQVLASLVEQLCPDLKQEFAQAKELGRDFDQLINSEVRTGILGIFKKPTLKEMTESGIQVLLDDPRDLDNIGAVVRVVAAAGASSLTVTGDANPWNFRAIRSGAGLQFALPVTAQKGSLTTNLPIICFDERGEELTAELKKEVPKDAFFVFGSERAGISEELKNKATRIVRLPMQKGVSSLNLATSVAAALYSLK